VRVVVKFREEGWVRYISHLDLQRSMQRVLRRSGLPLKWSQGFHPHPLLTFAMALQVGVSSAGEYMEFEVEDECDVNIIRPCIEKVLPAELAAVEIGILDDAVPSLMSRVSASGWYIEIVDEADEHIVEQKINTLLSADEIIVEKWSKKGPRKVDIRPGIYELCLKNDGGRLVIDTVLAAGSVNNVTPEQVMSALFEEDIPFCRTKRQELFMGERDNLVSMIKLCKVLI